MIGKISTGKSFRGCISYCLEDKLLKSKQVAFKNRAEVLMYNQCFGDKKELIEQFNELRDLNSKLSKPVLHITLSLAPDEKLDKGTLCKMVEDCANELGFENNQFIAVSHIDTNHQHLHIVVNRIGLDGKTLSDSNNYKKIAAYCRKMEQKYQLKQVLSPRRFLSKEMRQLPRYDSRKEAIKNDVRECLLSSKTFNEFETAIKQKSYQVRRGRGIAFIDSKGVYMKGSELGYSLARIEKVLELPLQQKQTELVKPNQNNLFQKQFIRFNELPDKILSNESFINTNPQANKILEDFLKPTNSNHNIPFQLLKKNKKKKRSQHL